MNMKTKNENWDVLLAEDDNDDVLSFELAMKEMPFSFILRNAENGDMLFVLLKERIPDILFLDILMPCRDGVTCIIEIRKNKDYNHMPVIMYTAMNSEEYIENAYKNGANFYLLKSNSINELTVNLKKIFSVDWKNFMYYPPKQQFVLS
jgi:DNA-binding response OmpR family regulator